MSEWGRTGSAVPYDSLAADCLEGTGITDIGKQTTV